MYVFEVTCEDVFLARVIDNCFRSEYGEVCDRDLNILKFDFNRSQDVIWFRSILRILKLRYRGDRLIVKEYEG